MAIQKIHAGTTFRLRGAMAVPHRFRLGLGGEQEFRHSQRKNCIAPSKLNNGQLYYQIRFTIVKRVNSSSGMSLRLPLPPLPFAPVS